MLNITSWAFDKPVYNPGETITLTVNYSTTDVTSSVTAQDFAVTVTVSDAAGNATQGSDGSVNFPNLAVNSQGAVTPEPTTVSVSDNRSPAGTWTLVSNTLSGTASPFTGVAVLTSVA